MKELHLCELLQFEVFYLTNNYSKVKVENNVHFHILVINNFMEKLIKIIF